MIFAEKNNKKWEYVWEVIIICVGDVLDKFFVYNFLLWKCHESHLIIFCLQQNFNKKNSFNRVRNKSQNDSGGNFVNSFNFLLWGFLNFIIFKIIKLHSSAAHGICSKHNRACLLKHHRYPVLCISTFFLSFCIYPLPIYFFKCQ